MCIFPAVWPSASDARLLHQAAVQVNVWYGGDWRIGHARKDEKAQEMGQSASVTSPYDSGRNVYGSQAICCEWTRSMIMTPYGRTEKGVGLKFN
jgi:hypothetical protein